MFLDHAGPQGDRRQRDFRAEGMIGVTDRNLECVSQGVHGTQVRISWTGWITAYTMQQDQFAISGLLHRAHRLLDLVQRGHAGRENHRLLFPGHIDQKGQIRQLTGWNFEHRDIQVAEQVGARLVKGTRHK